MINLLSPKEKNRLEKEVKVNLVFNLGLLSLFLLLSLNLILLTVFFKIKGRLDVEQEFLSVARGEMKKKEKEDLRKDIDFYNEASQKILTYEKERASMVKSLEKIKKAKPKGARLQNFSYEKGSVSLSGYCPTRDSLLVFRRGLEDEFERVEFPASNWVKAEDISFVVSLGVEEDE